jgi:ectoine hydroxylase-related dioxygenase (phytanoyl-CoA dioxygenase family)
MQLEHFNEYGFLIVENAFDNQTVDRLIEELSIRNFGDAAKQRESVAFGVRNLLNVAPAFREFVNSEDVRKLIEPIAGKQAQIVRAIFFDKTPEANWKVPFHQDLTIAVKERKEVDGFVSWTMKANILHVQPPASVLENIVALRVHLDDTDESNGALRVIAGTHRFGRLNAEQPENLKITGETITCRVDSGGAMLMRPLLLHASSVATNASHRRVLHFEFSSEKLNGGLQWFGS